MKPVIHGLIIGCLAIAYSCSVSSNRDLLVSESFEQLNLEDGSWMSSQHPFKAGGAEQRSDLQAQSGRYSIRLDPQGPYGVNYSIRSVRTDEFIRVQVSCYGQGAAILVASHDDPAVFYRTIQLDHPAGDEWKELKLEFSVPPTMNKERLQIYVWNPKQEPVFIDDFELTYQKQKAYPAYDPEIGLHLFIDTLDLVKLERKRDEAFEKGILETAENDYVDGIMFYKDTIMPIEMRLKGDWLDHLEGRKWSFRIKLRQGYTWNSIRTFSIHTPEARDFLNEWLGHELYRDLDILAPRYGFVPVTLNGKSLGVYAWEEHFEKQLVESLSRREGPIMKFAEDHFWVSHKVFNTDSIYLTLPFLQTADILPFKANRVFGDTLLMSQFLLAQNRMHQYRSGLYPLSEVFDLDKLAAYYALMDLTRGFHGLAWHNQRCYYNPVIDKLEPIYFDAYADWGAYAIPGQAISGFSKPQVDTLIKYEDYFKYRPYQDLEFIRSYQKWLAKVSEPGLVDDFVTRHEDQLQEYLELIQSEFPAYLYDMDFLPENAKQIQQELPSFDAFVAKQTDSIDHFGEVNIESYHTQYHPAFPPNFVKVNHLVDAAGTAHLQIRNYYTQPIWVVGAGVTNRERAMTAISPYKIPAFVNQKPGMYELSGDEEAGYVFFKVDHQQDLFSVAIDNYPHPHFYSPSQALQDQYAMQLPDGVQVMDSTIRFQSGEIKANHPMVIPAGYRVEFEAGCHLVLSDSASFISWSPVTMKGNAINPIRIAGKTEGMNGFTVLQAKELSTVEHVQFTGLSNLDYRGWTLTGAVNFYESPVHIDSCSFTYNHCEDALNIIRTHFLVTNSHFKHTFADAFDSDFCTGEVSQVIFEAIGNDAIDFSGSVVDIRHCQIHQAGDKGVSCGEQSILTVNNTSVREANIGFASKDRSELILNECSGKNLVYGLMAFQKKPEFGPAQLWVNASSFTQVDTLTLIERFSTLWLNKEKIVGDRESVAKRFY